MTVPDSAGSAAPSSLPLFDVTVEYGDPGSIVVVAGDMDLVTTPQVADVVLPFLDEEDGTVGAVIIDLTDVTFLGSDAIALLVLCHRRATPAHRFRIVAATSLTMRPLQLTGLTEILAIFPSRDLAVQAPQPEPDPEPQSRSWSQPGGAITAQAC
jgi:anti-anti-sigma factor